MSILIGIDAGTSMIKSVAFDEHGNVVDSASVSSGFDSPRRGWAETDMERSWAAVAQTTAELTARLGSRTSEIKAVGVSATMVGAWMIDGAGQPVRPAILWNDGRAVRVLDEWRRSGVADRISALSGNASTPGFSAVVLRWLADNEPESLERASTLLFHKDWIRYRLTGEIATDETDASHFPGDLRARGYSAEVLALCGLESLRGLLPRVIGSGEIAGTVTAAASAATGLPVGISVIAGLADVSSSIVGSGAREGEAVTTLGTSCLNSVLTREPLVEPRGVGLGFLLPEGLFVRSLPNQTGTLAIDWVRRTLFGATELDYEEAERLARSVPAGARGLVFHPYLNSTGVVSPVYEPRARGRLTGIEIGHSAADIVRAVYEGLALSVADNYAAIPVQPSRTILVGGGARSRLLSELVTDALAGPVHVRLCDEPGALGVAMLAGVAVGVWSSMEEARAATRQEDRIVEPDPGRQAVYARKLRTYQYLRNRLSAEADHGGDDEQ